VLTVVPGEIDADGTIVGRFNPLLVCGPRDLAVEDGLLVAAYHVRGAGRVERRGTAFGIVYEAT
jgi:hypothetical protein